MRKWLKNPEFWKFWVFKTFHGFSSIAHPHRGTESIIPGTDTNGEGNGLCVNAPAPVAAVITSHLRSRVRINILSSGYFQDRAYRNSSARQWISKPRSLAFGDTGTRWPLGLRTGSTPYWGTERHRSRQVNGLGDCPSGPIRNLPVFGMRVSKYAVLRKKGPGNLIFKT